MRRALRGTAMVAAVLLAACGDSPAGPEEVLRLEVLSGDEQRGLERRALPEPVVLRVVDAAGLPVARRAVEVSVSGGGSVSPRTAVSGPTGKIEVRWTLGPAATAVQVLRALPDRGAQPAAVSARALPEALADRIILRGALAPPKGVVLTREDIRSMDVVLEVAEADTLFLLQPRSDSTGLVVFPTADALAWQEVAWTDGPDTVVIEMRPPVPVDVLVRVYVAPFAEMKATAEADLARTARIWEKRGMGIRLGEVTYLDLVEPGRRTSATPEAVCTLPATARLELNYVHLVRSQPAAGQGCPPGQAFMGATASERSPYLAAHEIGHTFTLQHRTPGMMDPRGPTTSVTEGEIFRANFDARSGINALFEGHPPDARRRCGFLGPCLDASYELGGG